MRFFFILTLFALFMQTSLACDDEDESTSSATDIRTGTTEDMSPPDTLTTEDQSNRDQEEDSLDSEGNEGDLTVPDARGDVPATHDLDPDEMSPDGHDVSQGPDLDEITGCDQILQAFWAETDLIRECAFGIQCGQVLYGTSCGCTQEWVALLEADLSRWEALRDMAFEDGCELPFMSDCSCPETDGYACVSGICTWNYL